MSTRLRLSQERDWKCTFLPFSFCRPNVQGNYSCLVGTLLFHSPCLYSFPPTLGPLICTHMHSQRQTLTIPYFTQPFFVCCAIGTCGAMSFTYLVFHLPTLRRLDYIQQQSKSFHRVLVLILGVSQRLPVWHYSPSFSFFASKWCENVQKRLKILFAIK